MSLLADLLGCPVITKSGDFTLSDPKACDNAIGCGMPKCDGCNREVLALTADTDVDIISMDAWLNEQSTARRKALQGHKICDYLLCDHEDPVGVRRIAFCDLTCSERKYIEPGASSKMPHGKRQYALDQMVSTADFFSAVEVVGQEVNTSTHRRLIFGFRTPETPVASSAPARAMLGFLKTPANTAGIVRTEQCVGDFSFTRFEVRYPAKLHW